VSVALVVLPRVLVRHASHTVVSAVSAVTEPRVRPALVVPAVPPPPPALVRFQRSVATVVMVVLPQAEMAATAVPAATRSSTVTGAAA